MFSVILKSVIFVLFAEKIAGETASNRSICSPDTELRLEGTGVNSSAIVTLDPGSKPFPLTCKLRISAPETHIIYISIIKGEDDSTEEEDNKPSDANCLLSVYVPENRRAAVWRSDMCSALTLNEGPLVPPQARLVWALPRTRSKREGSGVKRLVLTALARGDRCTRANTHACLKLGWTPLTCIAQELVCDGVVNCPGGGNSDEDVELCREKKTLSKTSWEKIASEFLKKFAGKSQNGAELTPTLLNDETNWFLGRHTIFRNPTTTEKSSKNQVKHRNRQETDTLGGLLRKYGPWGYLMLGMLVCGAALMVCGLWECCFRKKKPSGSNRIPTRPPSSVPQSTTVLIINSQGNTAHGDEASQSPPNYEDLEQPPSYNALFPPDK